MADGKPTVGRKSEYKQFRQIMEYRTRAGRIAPAPTTGQINVSMYYYSVTQNVHTHSVLDVRYRNIYIYTLPQMKFARRLHTSFKF